MDKAEKLEKIIQEQGILGSVMLPAFFSPDSAEAEAALLQLLRILTEDPNLTIDSYESVFDVSNAGEHGARLDIKARDGVGERINIRLQRIWDDPEDAVARAIYESSVMLVASADAHEVAGQYDQPIVIFLARAIPGEPDEPVLRARMTLEGTPIIGMPKSPECILLNGQFHDTGTLLGQLIADLKEPDPEKVKTPLLRQRMKQLKNTPEGRKEIAQAIDRCEKDMAEREDIGSLIRRLSRQSGDRN